jgi:hypothetical protein
VIGRMGDPESLVSRRGVALEMKGKVGRAQGTRRLAVGKYLMDNAS